MERQASMEPAEESSTSFSEQHFVRGSLLGSGSYGRVTMALDSQTGKLFAAKSVDTTKRDSHSGVNLQAIENEIKMLSSLDSPYIVRYLGNSWSTEEASDGTQVAYRNLHLELAPGGSIASFMKALGGKGLGMPLVRRYTQDIIQGLSYLHSNDIIHGDIKCLNVLIGESSAKLADFGTSCRVGSSDESLKGLKGSPSWMSPETVKELSSQGTAVDIWSLGCTILEMATGKVPWSEVEGGVYGIFYALGCTDSLPHVPHTLPANLRDLIQKCLRRNPDERPSAAELLSHPFMQEAADCNASTAASSDNRQGQLDGPISPVSVSPVSGSFNSECEFDYPCEQLHIAPTHSPMKTRKRHLAMLESSTKTFSQIPLAAKRRRRSAGLDHDTLTSVDSATPLFPLVEIAKSKSRLWCLSDFPSLPQSPLSKEASKWIVVHSSTPAQHPARLNSLS